MEGHNMLTLGTIVELHPATDDWMRGDRYGEIVGLGRKRQYMSGSGADKVLTEARPYKVKLDRSGRIKRFHPELVNAI